MTQDRFDMRKIVRVMLGGMLLSVINSYAMTEVGLAQMRFWRSPTELVTTPKPIPLKPTKQALASFPAYRVPQGTPSDPVAIYLMAGQSNLVGAARLTHAHPAEVAPFEAAQIWSDALGFVPLAVGFDGQREYLGPEYSFGQRIIERRRESLYIIKVGLGATTLAEDWHPAGVNNWYDRLNETVAITLAELSAQGLAYEIQGLVWMQGESDVWNADFAAAYEENLTLLIADLRRRYGDELEVAIGLIRGDLPADNPSPLPVVRTAQRAVAARDTRTFLVDTDTFGAGSVVLQADAVHYNATGQVRLGVAFANRFKSGLD
ncbi:MAG: sialate O-acetylesterase [Cyanobacteria bacterium P01_D01_bin.105]